MKLPRRIEWNCTHLSILSPSPTPQQKTKQKNIHPAPLRARSQAISYCFDSFQFALWPAPPSVKQSRKILGPVREVMLGGCRLCGRWLNERRTRDITLSNAHRSTDNATASLRRLTTGSALPAACSVRLGTPQTREVQPLDTGSPTPRYGKCIGCRGRTNRNRNQFSILMSQKPTYVLCSRVCVCGGGGGGPSFVFVRSIPRRVGFGEGMCVCVCVGGGGGRIFNCLCLLYPTMASPVLIKRFDFLKPLIRKWYTLTKAAFRLSIYILTSDQDDIYVLWKAHKNFIPCLS